MVKTRAQKLLEKNQIESKKIDKKVNIINILDKNIEEESKKYYDEKEIKYVNDNNNPYKYRDFIILDNNDDNINNYKKNIDDFYNYVKDCNNKILKSINLNSSNTHYELYNWIKYGLANKLIEPKNIYHILDMENDKMFGKSVFSLVYRYFMTMKEISKEKNCIDFFELILVYFPKFFDSDDEWYNILLPQILDKSLEFIREYNSLIGHIVFQYFYPSLSDDVVKPKYRYYSTREHKPLKINDLEYLKSKSIFSQNLHKFIAFP